MLILASSPQLNRGLELLALYLSFITAEEWFPQLPPELSLSTTAPFSSDCPEDARSNPSQLPKGQREPVRAGSLLRHSSTLAQTKDLVYLICGLLAQNSYYFAFCLAAYLPISGRSLKSSITKGQGAFFSESAHEILIEALQQTKRPLFTFP